MENRIAGYIVDIPTRRIFPGLIHFHEGHIDTIEEVKDHVPKRYILPGFVDAHVHVESSMLVPSEFARFAVRHGTVASVSDPHEIANVLGMKGVQFMIDNGNEVPFKFYFGAPSCVPATKYETAGAEISVDDIIELMSRDDIKYLSEMMNWPGVLQRDESVMAKIEAAQFAGKPVDGHAPGLRGEQVRKYAQAGISTDHESFSMEEAQDKLAAGMKIIIREGSAAKNFEALIPLMNDHSDELMFCSDDKHPDELVNGHIQDLVRRALRKGYDLFDVLKAACINPVMHYGLNVGSLQTGDPADFIIVDSLADLNILGTYIDGEEVFNGYDVLFSRPEVSIINQFSCDPITTEDIDIMDQSDEFSVIEAMDGQLVTGSFREKILRNEEGKMISDPNRDILKIVVVNRYKKASPSVGFIRGFGLRSGAISSTVAHDSHNIIAVGVEDQAIVQSVNRLIEEKGGICVVDHLGHEECLPLPVAGLMSVGRGEDVAEQYKMLGQKAKSLGSLLSSPFMTLSFMALLVIPQLKISDRGLFDGEKFEFV